MVVTKACASLIFMLSLSVALKAHSTAHQTECERIPENEHEYLNIQKFRANEQEEGDILRNVCLHLIHDKLLEQDLCRHGFMTKK